MTHLISREKAQEIAAQVRQDSIEARKYAEEMMANLHRDIDKHLEKTHKKTEPTKPLSLPKKIMQWFR